MVVGYFLTVEHIQNAETSSDLDYFVHLHSDILR